MQFEVPFSDVLFEFRYLSERDVGGFLPENRSVYVEVQTIIPPVSPAGQYRAGEKHFCMSFYDVLAEMHRGVIGDSRISSAFEQ
jgi:hypothetical protein